MLALNKITRAKISACNVIPRLIFPGEISRDYSKKIDVDLPTKPKKPAPAFFQYLKESKSSLEREFPSHKWQDVVKIASERWRNSSPDFKKPYEETFFKNRVNHFYELNSYENKLTEEQKALIEQQKDEVSKKRAKTKLKKGMNELGKPKGPPGSYALFFAAKKGQRNAGESVTQYSSRVASDWKNLPEIEKQTYINQAKALRLQFEKDMDVWRRKALQVQSEDPLVKNAQEKLKLQEERRKEKLAKQDKGGNREE